MATPTQLDTWLREFPRGEVESRIEELEGELARWRDALALHQRLEPSDGARQTTRQTDAPPNRPEAIRTVLRLNGNAPMLAGAIKEAMVENDWLEDAPAPLKRFYGSLSTMNRRGHLLRLQDKRYMLPQDSLGGGNV